ncbi:MBL fold metallo-hydrolase [Romboutsia sp.]|uniref:MBL fold metallo-hydrolase n=1 Tax=Romboutsia sp. TaxID=1965302 RepID=UPI003F3BDEEB
MELTNIKGDTYYIKGGTNTGIYLYNNNEGLGIDPGLCGLRPKKIMEVLEEKNIKLRYIINTHEHNDHYGACNEFKEKYKDLNILSSEYSKLYMENPELFSKYIIGGKSNKFIDGKLKSKSLEPVKVDVVINEGKINLDKIELDVMSFKGHTPGSIGIMTKDKVLFAGDLLISPEVLRKYDFLFTFDIEEQIKSLEKIKNIDFDYLVLGHGKNVISKEESYELIEKNRQALEKYINEVRKNLYPPIGLENLLKNIIINNQLRYNYKEYYFYKTSLVSVISYLEDLNEIDYLQSEGELLYYTQKK